MKFSVNTYKNSRNDYKSAIEYCTEVGGEELSDIFREVFELVLNHFKKYSNKKPYIPALEEPKNIKYTFEYLHLCEFLIGRIPKSIESYEELFTEMSKSDEFSVLVSHISDKEIMTKTKIEPEYFYLVQKFIQNRLNTENYYYNSIYMGILFEYVNRMNKINL